MSKPLNRIEKDSLGDVPVPADALYGAQTQRAVVNFRVSGLKPWPVFIWSVAVIKLAAAKVNHALGLLDASQRDAIVQAAEEITQGKWKDQFVVDPFQAGAGTSHHMNVNEVIANRATQILGGQLGEYRIHPNDHVNMAQSTNDVIPTAIRLGCLLRHGELLAAVENLSSALWEKSIEFDDILKSGRTHLQDAVPLRMGQEFGAYAHAIERDAERIRRSGEYLRRVGIGGTAVGTGLNAHRDFQAKMVEQLRAETGLNLSPAPDLFEAMQSMADFADYSAAIRTLAITLTRVANDFRLLASGPATGLDELYLPPVQPGSSIMPGKVNPVMAEMLNMAMFHVQGCDHTVALAAQAGQLELNVMMPILAHHLFEMMQVAIGSIRSFTQLCVRGLRANRPKTEGWLAKNAIVVTALNPLIGYAQGAALVKQALARNVSIREVAVEKAGMGLLKHRDHDQPVTPQEVDAALRNVDRLTRGGLVGPAHLGG
jgi:fumarate hydratase class II